MALPGALVLPASRLLRRPMKRSRGPDLLLSAIRRSPDAVLSMVHRFEGLQAAAAAAKNFGLAVQSPPGGSCSRNVLLINAFYSLCSTPRMLGRGCRRARRRSPSLWPAAAWPTCLALDQ